MLTDEGIPVLLQLSYAQQRQLEREALEAEKAKKMQEDEQQLEAVSKCCSMRNSEYHMH